jgi:WD40 repeat protein
MPKSMTTDMNTRIADTAVSILPSDHPPCWLFPGFLSDAECDREIATARACGFQNAGSDFPPTYRNNQRLVRDDPATADALYARLLSRIDVAALAQTSGGRRWQPAGVNPRLRYCRYESGQAFQLHQDGVRYENDGRRSFLTFMIYLDDPGRFEGGATRFFAHGPEGDARGDHPVLLSLRPPRGSLIVFDHALWHDGAEVLAGTKHVLRSDLMFVADAFQGVEPIAHAPFSPGHSGYVWKLVALADGRVASAGRDTLIRIWSAQGEPEGALAGHTQSVLAMAQASKSTLFTLSRDRTLRQWDLDRGIETGRAIAHAAAGLALVVGRDGDLFSAGADGALYRWHGMDLIAGRESAHAEWIWDLAAHDTAVISAGEDGFARIWQQEDLAPLAALPHSHPLRAAAVGNDAEGIIAVFGDMHGTLHYWRETSDGEWRLLGRQPRHRAAVRALRWLLDGRLGSSGEDGRVFIGDCAPDASWHETARHHNFATDLLAFEDGRLLSAGYDGALRVANWKSTAPVVRMDNATEGR